MWRELHSPGKKGSPSFNTRFLKRVPDEALKCRLHLLSFYSNQEGRKRGNRSERNEAALSNRKSYKGC